jgi:hypothetical protein
MKDRTRIRLSAMELVLIGTLGGALLLILLEAWQDARRLRAIEEARDDQ